VVVAAILCIVIMLAVIAWVELQGIDGDDKDKKE
jgi:hypothetical protein